MSDGSFPAKDAVVELGNWIDKWRDEPVLEPLNSAVYEAWLDYVSGCGLFEMPRIEGKLADVIPLRKQQGEWPE